MKLLESDSDVLAEAVANPTATERHQSAASPTGTSEGTNLLQTETSEPAAAAAEQTSPQRSLPPGSPMQDAPKQQVK